MMKFIVNLICWSIKVDMSIVAFQIVIALASVPVHGDTSTGVVGDFNLAFILFHKVKFGWNCDSVLPGWAGFFVPYLLGFLLLLLSLLNPCKVVGHALLIEITDLSGGGDLYLLFNRIKSALVEFSLKVILSLNVEFLLFLFQPTVWSVNDVIMVFHVVFRTI